MSTASARCQFGTLAHFCGNSRVLPTNMESSAVSFPFSGKNLRFYLYTSSASFNESKEFLGQLHALPDEDDLFSQKLPTPVLDTVENQMHLKTLSSKDLKQLAADIRSELSFLMVKTGKFMKASLAVVELTIAIHYVFFAPTDKILWDVSEQTYAHKILTGRRALLRTLGQKEGVSGCTSHSESEFDPFGAGHGCNSISAGLGLAIARDMKGKRDRVVAVIANVTTTAGQLYEAMSNTGYLDSDMVVILNDSRRSLHPKLEEAVETPINALSGTLSKLQSSRLFRKFRAVAKALTKKLGMHAWAAKVDEYVRGMVGPLGSTLFEELGLYYIGPVDGHNIEDLVCVLREVSSLDCTGPVLVHVITWEDKDLQVVQKREMTKEDQNGSSYSESQSSNRHSQTYSDCFVECLLMEAERDKDIVTVHAGLGMEPSLRLFQSKFPDRYFDVGMAEQHAVTFSAGLSCGGLKPFCVIPSAFLQRAYDQVPFPTPQLTLAEPENKYCT